MVLPLRVAVKIQSAVCLKELNATEHTAENYSL